MELGDIFYVEDYNNAIEYISKNNYVIEEIDSDFKGRRFKIAENKPMNNYLNELLTLKAWFEREYTYKEQKYRRLIALKKKDDDGIDANTKLSLLYVEAEEKRNRIQELEKII